MAKKDLILVTTESGCIIPISHKLNKDGYFRKVINSKHQMYHRYTWESVNGEIPDGYEINHLCKNRACCNIHHLECIDGALHAIISNTGRFSERKEAAKLHWETTSDSALQIASKFNVSWRTVYKWIAQWKV